MILQGYLFIIFSPLNINSVKARMERNREKRVEKKMDRIRYNSLLFSLIVYFSELHNREKERESNFMSQLGIDFSKGV